jgi:hypothetical protein
VRVCTRTAQEAPTGGEVRGPAIRDMSDRWAHVRVWVLVCWGSICISVHLRMCCHKLVEFAKCMLMFGSGAVGGWVRGWVGGWVGGRVPVCRHVHPGCAGLTVCLFTSLHFTSLTWPG